MESFVTISRGLYTLLVKEAHDAECLKKLIGERYRDYRTISRDELGMLYTLYFGSEPNGEGEPE